MDEVLTKYNALDSFFQNQVLQYIDYLLSMKKSSEQINMSAYKEKILNVSTWREEDLEILNNNSKQFSEWKMEEF